MDDRKRRLLSQIFAVVIGLLFYRRQQLGARLLQGASVVVQILFGIATITIIR